MLRLTVILLAVSIPLLYAADEPDGTAFQHTVIGVDGADLVRVNYCGIPLRVKLGNVQFKGADSEKEGQHYLSTTLRPGTSVRLEIERDAAGDGTQPPQAQVFAGSAHVNVELVKRGIALSDGRSQKYGTEMQNAQMQAMTKKIGIWAESDKPPEKHVAQTQSQPVPAGSFAPVLPEIAPAGYNGGVVADLSGKEYHYPGSRFARNIRPGARIDYKSPEEAERAGKTPSPFSFPDRAKVFAAKQAASSATETPERVVAGARKSLEEALVYMREARKASLNNNALANENWKKAAKILYDTLNRLTPVADANPNDQEIQRLAEDVSMNLYSCNKYQSL